MNDLAMTVAAPDDPTQALEMTPEARAEYVVHRLVDAGVPPRFADRRLTTFADRRGTAQARRAAEAMGRGEVEGLVLSGPPGVGKTHLAVGVLAARLDGHYARWPRAWWEAEDEGGRIRTRPPLAVRFVVVPTFLDELRSAIRYADREDPLPGLFDMDLVVLDDLGREKVTDWASERLYVLVNERYNRRLPTLVTTNYEVGELVDRGYDALVSRLVEGAGVVSMRATDYRREAVR